MKPPAAPTPSAVLVCAFMDFYSVGIPVCNFQSLVNRHNIGDIRRRLAAFMLYAR
jgi:hypothetical protein